MVNQLPRWRAPTKRALVALSRSTWPASPSRPCATSCREGSRSRIDLGYEGPGPARRSRGPRMQVTGCAAAARDDPQPRRQWLHHAGGRHRSRCASSDPGSAEVVVLQVEDSGPGHRCRPRTRIWCRALEPTSTAPPGPGHRGGSRSSTTPRSAQTPACAIVPGRASRLRAAFRARGAVHAALPDLFPPGRAQQRARRARTAGPDGPFQLAALSGRRSRARLLRLPAS